MTTIASDKNLVTKYSCDQNVKTMTDKIDKVKDKLVDFEIGVTKQFAEMPKNLADEFDNRYANKKTEKTVDRLQLLVITSVTVALLALVLK